MTEAVENPPQLAAEALVWEQLAQAPELLRAIAEAQQTPQPTGQARMAFELRLQKELRSQYPEALVRCGLLLVDLRKRGADKFSRADRLWFDRVGLEQATSEPVARHKAARFQARAAQAPVWDLCCGIGADTVVLAEQHSVAAFDLRDAACTFARLNLAACGVTANATVHRGDVQEMSLEGKIIHVDPDRRAATGRAKRIEHYQPPLPWLQDLATKAAGGAMKLSPASNFGGKFPETETELISLDGECKEAVIWFGSLRETESHRATVLTRSGLTATIAANPWDFRPDVQPLSTYLYDPDPAVVRAGLVDAVADQLGLFRLDDAEEYLTGPTLVTSPFVRPFEVIAEISNNDREVRAWFRGSGIGRLEIKCRHVPVAVDTYRKQLPLAGAEEAVLFIARLQGRTRCVIGRRIRP